MKRQSIWLQDLFFLYRYGFLLVYGIFTIVYICILQVIPADYQALVMRLLIFTDPAAMGLFFMGAIVLLEKSQRVQSALAVSPLSVSSYILGKIVSFLITGEIVAVIIALSTGMHEIGGIMIGVAFGSILFSLAGLILAIYARSLNHFMLISVIAELLITLPGVLKLFGLEHFLLTINPGAMVVELMDGMGTRQVLFCLILSCEIVILFHICKELTKRSFQRLGGAKL